MSKKPTGGGTGGEIGLQQLAGKLEKYIIPSISRIQLCTIQIGVTTAQHYHNIRFFGGST
jgi:hypothetical protein